MPQLLEHIDKIARDKKRDVLYIEFNETQGKTDIKNYFSYDYETDTKRIDFIKWLNDNKVPFKECGPIARENSWESYRGQLYIDIPMDENDKRYLKLNEHLEYENGDMKISGIMYYHVPLKVAMKNAHHDEPGFWDKWAENF